MKTSASSFIQSTIFTLALGATITSASTIQNVSYDDAQKSSDDVPVIETSKPHHLPQLLTIRTAKVLESYDVGIAGSGNIYTMIKSHDKDSFKGNIALGLGGVVELGFEMKELNSASINEKNMMNGHIKLQLAQESQLLPAVSVSAGQNLYGNMNTADGKSFRLEETNLELMLAKSFHIGSTEFNILPGMRFEQDQISKFDTITYKKPGRNSTYDANLGVTWQSQPAVLFIYEFKYMRPLNLDNTPVNKKVAYDTRYENNIGVRYYLKNWLFIDSGIRYSKNVRSSEEDTPDNLKIHANLCGVLPLKSIYNRTVNH